MSIDIAPIKTVDGPCGKFIPDAVLKSTVPLVIRRLVDHWPVVEAAQQSAEDAFHYISQFYNGQLVNAVLGKEGEGGEVFYSPDMSGFNYERKRTNLNTFFSEITSTSKLKSPPLRYVDSVLVDRYLPGFRDKNYLNMGEISSRVSLWAGNKTIVSAHYDIPNNIACVVAGARRFILFPPEQLKNLYVGPLDHNPAGPAISLVDLNNPDYEKFPKFKEAIKHAQVAELFPGDAIFIPSMWWHHVEGIESQNAMVNYWWSDSADYLGSPHDAFNHALLSIKNLPKCQRDAWKNIFDYYIFDSKKDSFDQIPDSYKGVLGVMDEDQARRLRAILLNRLNQ